MSTTEQLQEAAQARVDMILAVLENFPDDCDDLKEDANMCVLACVTSAISIIVKCADPTISESACSRIMEGFRELVDKEMEAAKERN